MYFLLSIIGPFVRKGINNNNNKLNLLHPFRFQLKIIGSIVGALFPIKIDLDPLGVNTGVSKWQYMMTILICSGFI